MPETSDTWSMSHLSHRPSNPIYHIEDCRVLRVFSSSVCLRTTAAPCKEGKRVLGRPKGTLG